MPQLQMYDVLFTAWLPARCGTPPAMVMSLAEMRPPNGPSSAPFASTAQTNPPAPLHVCAGLVRTSAGVVDSGPGKSTDGADGVSAASRRETTARAIIGLNGSISIQAATKPLPSGAASIDG